MMQIKNSTLYILKINIEVLRGQKSKISVQNLLLKQSEKFHYFQMMFTTDKA